MLIRLWPIVIPVATLLAAATARAQVVEEKETEVLKPVADTYDPANSPDLAAAVMRIVELTNELRQQEKAKKVEVNLKLGQAAQYFADYMARTSRYGHKADGNAPDSRAKKYDYEYCIIAENIAYQYSSVGFTTLELAKKFYEGWKASPGHHKNMVDPDVVETGVAIAQGESGYFFAVQMFGRPESMSIEFKITNHSGTVVKYKMGDQTFDLDLRVTRTHQGCRLGDLAFGWSDTDGKEQLVQPKAGDRFVATQEGEAVRIEKE